MMATCLLLLVRRIGNHDDHPTLPLQSARDDPGSELCTLCSPGLDLQACFSLGSGQSSRKVATATRERNGTERADETPPDTVGGGKLANGDARGAHSRFLLLVFPHMFRRAIERKTTPMCMETRPSGQAWYSYGKEWYTAHRGAEPQGAAGLPRPKTCLYTPTCNKHTASTLVKLLGAMAAPFAMCTQMTTRWRLQLHVGLGKSSTPSPPSREESLPPSGRYNEMPTLGTSGQKCELIELGSRQAWSHEQYGQNGFALGASAGHSAEPVALQPLERM